MNIKPSLIACIIFTVVVTLPLGIYEHHTKKVASDLLSQCRQDRLDRDYRNWEREKIERHRRGDIVILRTPFITKASNVTVKMTWVTNRMSLRERALVVYQEAEIERKKKEEEARQKSLDAEQKEFEKRLRECGIGKYTIKREDTIVYSQAFEIGTVPTIHTHTSNFIAESDGIKFAMISYGDPSMSLGPYMLGECHKCNKLRRLGVATSLTEIGRLLSLKNPCPFCLNDDRTQKPDEFKKALETFIKKKIPDGGWVECDGVVISSEGGKIYGMPSSIPTADGLSGYTFSREEITCMKDFSALIKRRDACIASVGTNEQKMKHLTPEQKYFNYRPKQ